MAVALAVALDERRDVEVGEPEVVAPLAHAVGLVDDAVGDGHIGRHGLDVVPEVRHLQALGRDEHKKVLARLDVALPERLPVVILAHEHRVGDRRRAMDAEGPEVVLLVLHQRGQRRDDQREAGLGERRKLVAQRLAGSGGEEADDRLQRERALDDVHLAGPELDLPEDVLEQIAQPPVPLGPLALGLGPDGARTGSREGRHVAGSRHGGRDGGNQVLREGVPGVDRRHAVVRRVGRLAGERQPQAARIGQPVDRAERLDGVVDGGDDGAEIEVAGIGEQQIRRAEAEDRLGDEGRQLGLRDRQEDEILDGRPLLVGHRAQVVGGAHEGGGHGAPDGPRHPVQRLLRPGRARIVGSDDGPPLGFEGDRTREAARALGVELVRPAEVERQAHEAVGVRRDDFDGEVDRFVERGRAGAAVLEHRQHAPVRNGEQAEPFVPEPCDEPIVEIALSPDAQLAIVVGHERRVGGFEDELRPQAGPQHAGEIRRPRAAPEHELPAVAALVEVGDAGARGLGEDVALEGEAARGGRAPLGELGDERAQQPRVALVEARRDRRIRDAEREAGPPRVHPAERRRREGVGAREQRGHGRRRVRRGRIAVKPGAARPCSVSGFHRCVSGSGAARVRVPPGRRVVYLRSRGRTRQIGRRGRYV